MFEREVLGHHPARALTPRRERLTHPFDEIGGWSRPAGGSIHQSHRCAPSAAGARRPDISGIENSFENSGGLIIDTLLPLFCPVC